MEAVIQKVDLDQAKDLLNQWLVKQAPSQAMAWFNEKKNKILEDKPGALYFITFSTIPNYFGTALLSLTAEDLKKADKIKKYWRPQNWSLSQTARALLLLSVASKYPREFKELIDKQFNAADIQELIAIYQALPLFPDPQQYLLHATNGIRSNMQSVFNAIALNNPYPKDFFDDLAWNQVVLKTLFVESPIEQVIGLKTKSNPSLARALINTALERYAANRPIKLELWCLVGLSTNKETIGLLEKLLENNNPIIKRGAMLACHFCPLPEAKELLKKQDDKVQDFQEDLEKLRHFSQEIIE